MDYEGSEPPPPYTPSSQATPLPSYEPCAHRPRDECVPPKKPIYFKSVQGIDHLTPKDTGLNRPFCKVCRRDMWTAEKEEQLWSPEAERSYNRTKQKLGRETWLCGNNECCMSKPEEQYKVKSYVGRRCSYCGNDMESRKFQKTKAKNEEKEESERKKKQLKRLL
ncbi:hypothetical protein HYALB_00008371 [Hymenoscyphus albidus]|uniref:Uncharacterized protein n=1 Tax=Hymenoscyphus albidus TaxID=595503 RepID=A0A9N9Q2U4_9HELO|nr:hypothetical protein HYALB_00008371 [Hymenoscyphus albidus]